MSLQYLVVTCDLNTLPEIARETDELDKANEKFEEITRRALDASVILYASKDDNVFRVFMQSEPILLVKAIELARKHSNHLLFRVRDHNAFRTDKFEKSETDLIKWIVRKLSDPSTPSRIEEHVIAPYYAIGDNDPKLFFAVATAGLYGGLSGSVLGFATGGPFGALFGGIVASACVGSGVKNFTCCYPCILCKGSGLEGKNYRCSDCDGYGYTRGKR